MGRRHTGQTVFDAALARLVEVYEAGHRVVVSFSAGKDSGVCVELAILAAQLTDRLPVEVIMRDDEIMFPGTFEYAERVAARPELQFHWIYACQPVINAFNRECPYFWVFDPQLPPEALVRTPPSIAYRIPDLNIERMVIPERFPPAEGKLLVSVIGLRVQESRRRMLGLHSSGSYLTKPNRWGVVGCRPIYDWTDADIWKAHHDHGWDYNAAYDVMARLGLPRKDLRIAPPTMNGAGIRSLALASRAWPAWFERVCSRLPGVRAAAAFGDRAVTPSRRFGETWEQCFQRTCIEEAPEWIADRARAAVAKFHSTHKHHSTQPLPEVTPCYHCTGGNGSWKKLAQALYFGDPFSVKMASVLPYVEPEFFRPGAGTWGGSPTF